MTDPTDPTPLRAARSSDRLPATLVPVTDQAVGLDDLLVAATDDDLELALDRFIAVGRSHLGTPVAVVLHPSLGGTSYASADARPGLLEAASRRGADPAATIVPIESPRSRLYGWFVIDRRPLDDLDAVLAERLARVLAAALSRISVAGAHLGTERRDPLTGLANRLALDAALWSAARDRSFPWTLIVAEVEGFDALADRVDDEIDDIMVALSDRLRGLVRDGDLAARIDDRRFGVLLNTGEDEAAPLADRIVAALSGPVVVHTSRHELSILQSRSTGNSVDEVVGLVATTLA